MAAIINTNGPNSNVKSKMQATRITFIAEETLPPPRTQKILSKRKFAPRMSRREYAEIQQRRRNVENTQLLEETPTRMLDGFLLLEACGVEFPDEASRADLQEMGLTGATGEDLKFFTNLVYVDVGENGMFDKNVLLRHSREPWDTKRYQYWSRMGSRDHMFVK